MPRSVKTFTRRSDEVVALTAQVEALQARLEKLERPSGIPSPFGGRQGGGSNGNAGGQGGSNQSRRDLLKFAGVGPPHGHDHQ